MAHLSGGSGGTPLLVLLLLLSLSFLPFATSSAGGRLLPDHALAAAQAAPYTGTSGTITLTVNGATFAAKNLTADANRNANFVFLMDPSAKVSVSATSPANPYQSTVTTSRLEFDQVAGSAAQAQGSSGQLTASGTVDDSLDYHGLGEITINLRFDCFVNCPARDTFAQRILLDFIVVPSVTVTSNATSVSVPGKIQLQGDVVPISQYANLYTFKDGVLQKWQGYNYEPLETDSRGHYTTTVAFSQQSQKGTYSFVVNVTSTHPALVPDAAVTAKASVSVSVGGTATTTTTSLPPVIFIPGVAGTELDSGSFEVWPLPAVKSMLVLALNRDGTTPASPGTVITTNGILSSGLANFYGGFLSNMTGLGYKKNQNLFTFPYDWRLDNLQQLPALDSLVNQVSQENGNAKVVLIGHSMGGLIATAYVLSSHARAAKIASIITMGTPYWGSPKVYYGLINGYTFANPDASQAVMKYDLQNFPAAYELLPRNYTFIQDAAGHYIPLAQAYSIFYKPPFLSLFSDNTQQMNPLLLKEKATFDALMGPKYSPSPLGVKQYVIIGTGVETLNSFTETTPAPGDSYLYLGRNVALEPHFDDGDGTVPIWSAQTSTATDTYYVSYVNRFGLGTSLRDISSEHGSLPGNPTVQGIVGKILQGNPPAQSSFPYEYSTGKTADYTEFELHSNANMTVTDTASGLSMGYNKNGGIGENASQGTFASMNGVEYAAVQNVSRTYKVSVQGTSTGEFTLSVNITRGGNLISSFSYPKVPVTAGTLATMTLTEGNLQAAPMLSVSNNGATGTTVSPTIVSFTPMKSAPPPSQGSAVSTLQSVLQPLSSAAGVVGTDTSTVIGAVTVLAVILLIVGAARKILRKK